MTNALAQTRIDLAAALRWSARLHYQQGVCNHYSVLAPGSDELFLVNPEGLFWSEVTASSLLLCDLDGKIVEGGGTVELSAFSLHAPIHRRNKTARAVLHTHAPYASALAATGQPLKTIHMDSAMLHGTTIIPSVRNDPLAIGAIRSW